MWLIKNGDSGEYEIGYYRTNGNYFTLWTCDNFMEAVRIVNYMNGGSGAIPDDIFVEDGK